MPFALNASQRKRTEGGLTRWRPMHHNEQIAIVAALVPSCLFGPDRFSAPAAPAAPKPATPPNSNIQTSIDHHFGRTKICASHSPSRHEPTMPPLVETRCHFLVLLFCSNLHSWLSWFELSWDLTAPQNWRNSNRPIKKAWVNFTRLRSLQNIRRRGGSTAVVHFLWPLFIEKALHVASPTSAFSCQE